jgi:hypothetical protein
LGWKNNTFTALTLVLIPANIMVSRTQKRKRYMLIFGVAGRAIWLVVGLVPYFLPMTLCGSGCSLSSLWLVCGDLRLLHQKLHTLDG